MIEAFDGIDRWVPRPVRITLTELVDRKSRHHPPTGPSPVIA